MDEVYDEFSEFSLNSPARKIRRLDAELPPIMEEEDPTVPLPVEQQMPEELMSAMPEFGAGMIDAELPIALNEEKALVLYKAVDNPFALSPGSSNVSFSVHSDLIHGLKNQAFWPANPNAVILEEISNDEKSVVANNLAVVPWVPPQQYDSRVMHTEEPMEAEEDDGGASMEVEEDIQQGVHQWPQHCLTPQAPENTSTPIMWSWG